MNDLSAPQQLLIQTISLVCIGIFVYLMTRWLRFHHEPWPYSNPRQSAWVALVTAVGPLLFLTLIGLSRASEAAPASTEVEIKYSLVSAINQLIAYLILLSPVFIAMKIRHESWQSAGVTKNNLGKSIMLGSLLGLIGILTYRECIAGILAGLTMSHLWAFLQFSVVGLAEEFGFRGYLQTRLCAWLGRWQGWLIASTLMALIHISGRTLISGLDPFTAFLSSAYLIPISMLMGFIMLRTDNVIAPAIFHTFADWVGIFA